MENREAKTTSVGSVTVSYGKPDKEGNRGVSAEFTVKSIEGESTEEFEKRYDYFKQKAFSELI